jgi:hypothetical protein
MSKTDHLDFAEFDALDDPRDVEARENAITLDRMAREATLQRDAIVRRLRHDLAIRPRAPIRAPALCRCAKSDFFP